jgi:FkbM family methyltransferase
MSKKRAHSGVSSNSNAGGRSAHTHILSGDTTNALDGVMLAYKQTDKPTNQSTAHAVGGALHRVADDDMLGTLEKQILEANKSLLELREYVEKNLYVSSIHYDLYGQRSARPYYPLDDGWALTYLNTGQPFFVNTEDRNLTPWIIMGGIWEPNVGLPLLSYAQPGMTILDIGAHIGYYTVKLGARAGSTGRVMAFEPNPKVNRVCLENIKINGLSGMTSLHKFALGDKAGNAKLTYSNSNMTSANLLGDQDADFSFDVDVFRLDDIVPEDHSVDLIKLDAEGFEAQILAGANGILSRSPQCAIMIELGLERWERSTPLESLMPLCGEGKVAYAVREDGMVELMAADKIRSFLLTCSFHENYFLIAPAEYAEKYIDKLIQR